MKETDEYDTIMRSMQRKQRRSGILYVLIPVLFIVMGWLFFEIRLKDLNGDLRSVKLSLRELNDSIKQKKTMLDSLRSSLASTQQELELVNNHLRGVKQAYDDKSLQPGIDSTVYLIQTQVKQAKKDLTVFVREVNNTQDISEVKIEYYDRKSDAGLVRASLGKLGFSNVEIKESKVKYDLQPSNYIYYGSNVDIGYVQLIAMALLSDGFDIKEIRPFSVKENNNNVIQIGRKSSIFQNKSITPEDVKKLS